MVYHRLDSGSSSSAAFQHESEAPRDAGEDSGGLPAGLEEGGAFPDRRGSWEGIDDERGPGNYRARESRYSERSRSRNGRDDMPRFGRSGFRSRDNRYYNRSRSRDRRASSFRERERMDDRFYDSPKHTDRQRYRESSRYHRDSRSGEGYEEGSRYIDKSRCPEDSRHLDESRYEPRYRDEQRFPEDNRSLDSHRYFESRFRDDTRYEDRRYSDNSRYDNESRYPESSRRGRHRESREEWGGDTRSRYREGKNRGSSRYSDDEAKYGESSSKWEDQVPAYEEAEDEDDDDNDDDDDEEETEESRSGVIQPQVVQNVFQNDGSFLEMFKKMQESTKPPEAKETEEVEQSIEDSAPTTANSPEIAAPSTGLKRPTASLVGKRRGGRVLPTGLVKKVKKVEEVEEEPPKDAWSIYMAEVRKYKEVSCEEEGKTRPLVK